MKLEKLNRIKELYKWGDIDKEQYLKEKAEIQQQLQLHAPVEDINHSLERLAGFLANVTQAWYEANQEQRNKLARCLFQEVWVKDKQVVAVKPQPELAPFFRLNHEETVNKIMKWRPRGGQIIMLDFILKLIQWKPHCISPFLTDRVVDYCPTFGLRSWPDIGVKAYASLLMNIVSPMRLLGEH